MPRVIACEMGDDGHLASLPFSLVLPHFAGLHTLSTVLSHVHKGHLADTPRLCNPYVLIAVTVARDDLIHLKHTSGISGSGMRVEVGGWKTPVSSQSLSHQPSFVPSPYWSYSHLVRKIQSSQDGEGGLSCIPHLLVHSGHRSNPHSGPDSKHNFIN